jgi:CRISPR-associated protein (TIGR03986 family)
VPRRLPADTGGLPPQAVTDAKDLCDGPPPGHDAWDPARWTGRIRVELTLVTPLLLLDPERQTEAANHHKIFPVLVRRSPDGSTAPWIPPSSIKGVVRAAFEAVTGSRLPRLDHDQLLGARMKAQSALSLVPVRLSRDAHGDLEIHLLTGTSAIGGNGRNIGPLYAASLPRYRAGLGGIAPWACRYPDQSLPAHGEEVTARLELMRHRRKPYEFWLVRDIVPRGRSLPTPNARQAPLNAVSLGKTREVDGYVFITNQNIKQKHDERVFFCDSTPRVIRATGLEAKRLLDQWEAVVRDYRSCHDPKSEIGARIKPDGTRARPDEYLGHEPGKTAWSPHQYEDGWKALGESTLAWAKLDSAQQKVEALFPVSISRDLHPCSPADLVPRFVKPAGRWGEFSPADRVFGWVHGSRGRADERQAPDTRPYRGHLTMGPVCCLDTDAIEDFGPEGLPLAILGAPKPRQARFYLGQPGGVALSDGDGDDRFHAGRELRGRKVYPHHATTPGGYWTDPLRDRTQEAAHGQGGGTWYQEYRRPDAPGTGPQRDSQNRTVLGWVRPGKRFIFEIDVDNLSAVELGALLYVLDLEEGRHLRLGGGKPLGFGSARSKVVVARLVTGHGLIERYSDLTGEGTATSPVEELKGRFLAAARVLWGEDPVHLKAWMQAAEGFDDGLPTRYPRATPNPDPEGKAYVWFVANQATGGPLRALPDLAGDPGLPIP